MRRVGVLGFGFINWGGGVDFLRQIVGSLTCASSQVEVHVILPTRGPRLAVRNLLKAAYWNVSTLLGTRESIPSGVDRRHIVDLMKSLGEQIYVHEIDYGVDALARFVRKLGLDVVLPSVVPLPSNFPIPWIGYVYDFQHRYFPDYFRVEELTRRDEEFHKMLTTARCVIVNARSVASDITKFYPNATAKIISLPFNAAPSKEWFSDDYSIVQLYMPDKPYFIVSNQFWKHKDHKTLFSAFAKFAETNDTIDLVCTGVVEDYRDPDYFPSLLQQLRDEGVADRVHILGMIPKRHQIALVKSAIALLQPTTFEGGPGGGAVFDAVSLGVPCVVSDIPVNLELEEPSIVFFHVRDYRSLSDALFQVVSMAKNVRPDAATLIHRGNLRRERCAEALLGAVDACSAPQISA